MEIQIILAQCGSPCSPHLTHRRRCPYLEVSVPDAESVELHPYRAFSFSAAGRGGHSYLDVSVPDAEGVELHPQSLQLLGSWPRVAPVRVAI